MQVKLSPIFVDNLPHIEFSGTFGDGILRTFSIPFQSFKDRKAFNLYLFNRLGRRPFLLPTKHNIKAYNKEVNEILGASSAFLYKLHRALQWKHCVVPYAYHVKKLGYNRSGVNATKVIAIQENFTILEQIRKDNLYHLAPLALAFRMNPHELKTLFGSTWKTLAKNSFSRNKLLVSAVSLGVADKLRHKTILQINDLPSSFLKGPFYFIWRDSAPSAWARWYLLHRKGEYTKFSKNTIGKDRHIRNLISDTKAMLSKEGKTFNPEWSENRIRTEHNEATKRLYKFQYSPEMFQCFKGTIFETFEGHFETKVKDFTFKLLKSPYEIYEEGREMSHCVASYIPRVSNMNYLVFSVTSDNKACPEKYTLGVTKNANSSSVMSDKLPVQFQQMYGKCNSIPTPTAHAAAEGFLNQINKKILSQKLY